MTTALSNTEIELALAGLPGWSRDGDTISKTFELDSYMAGLALATAIGTVCEGFNHHPDMLIGWRKVTITLTTHDAGHKISQKDIDAAKKIEVAWLPAMNLLLRVFGWPHESLHVVALWLIGRRPEAVAARHVDIPADLTTRQYVFVAGFPALVFWAAAAISLRLLLRAPDVLQALLWLALALICTLAAFGTVGDLQLILLRLLSGPDSQR